MKKYKLTKEQALFNLASRLPGHDLEAMELMSLALHGLTVQFLMIYSLTWNAETRRFEILDRDQ